MEIYTPREDSFLLKDSIINYLKENSFLIKDILNIIEIGAGTGFISHCIFQYVCSINPNIIFYLTDINPYAIKYLNEQYKNLIKQKKFNIINSYLFNKLDFIFKNDSKEKINRKTKEKINLILFNPPYLPESHEKIGNNISITGGIKGNELILQFIEQLNQLKKYNLNIKTKIFLLISSLSGLKDIFLSLKNKNIKFKIISNRSFFFEKLYVLYFEL